MGLLRSLPPAATERLSELTLLLPELPGGDYSFSEVGTHPPPPPPAPVKGLLHCCCCFDVGKMGMAKQLIGNLKI